MIALVLSMVLSGQSRDLSLLLTLCVCCMTVTAGMQYLEPIISFLTKLESIGKLNPEILKIILKAVGIGILAEITGLICTDAGNQALSRGIQIAASAAILWISIPMLNELLTLVEQILGAI